MGWDGIERRKKGGSMNPEDCPIGVRHEAEIIALKEATAIVAKDVKDIKERLLGRPSWTVTVIITLLSTMAFSSLTFAFQLIHELTKLKSGG